MVPDLVCNIREDQLPDSHMTDDDTFFFFHFFVPSLKVTDPYRTYHLFSFCPGPVVLLWFIYKSKLVAKSYFVDGSMD